jgi:hypothetical protein
MIKKFTEALEWVAGKLENLFRETGENYARELLAAHGLLEIEADHIRQNTAKGEPEPLNYQI